MHDLENARQQSRGLKRAHALLLQQVRQRVNLGRKFSECVSGARPASAGLRSRVRHSARSKRIIAFAQRRNHVGKCLQRTNQALNQCSSHDDKK